MTDLEQNLAIPANSVPKSEKEALRTIKPLILSHNVRKVESFFHIAEILSHPFLKPEAHVTSFFFNALYKQLLSSRDLSSATFRIHVT